MHFLLLSIVLSVSVSVLLKLAPRLKLDIRQAILVNYLVAAAVVWWRFQPDLAPLTQATLPVWGLLLALGLGLPGMFWVLAVSVRRAGVVRTDAAMRLSLLLPLLAAFLLFGETLTAGKLAGIVLGLVAIALIVARPGRTAVAAGTREVAILGLVFLGMGVIDILFKSMARLTPASSVSVLLAAFMLAALVSLIAVVALYWRGRAGWAWRHLFAGLILGVLNVGNIVFYIRAHRALPGDPALVFAAMNIGVIVLATLVGLLAFRERLARINVIGLFLAVFAVLTLARF